MGKRYFSKKSRWEPKLFIIMGIITGIFALVLGALQVFSGSGGALRVIGGTDPGQAQEILQKARTLMEQGVWEEAEQLLQPLLRGRDSVTAPRAVLLQADIEHYRGAPEVALSLLNDAATAYRNSSEYPYVAERLARQYEEMGKIEEARSIYELLRDNAPPEMRAAGNLGLGRLMEKSGDMLQARELYRIAADEAPWGSAGWEESVEHLGQVNVALIFSPVATPESKYYTVEAGDSLISIGNKLNTTQGLLVTANNISDTARLSLGQRLKYTPKDFYIIIERSTCTLYLFDNRGLFKRYRVGLGKPGHETTLGKYTIGNKQKDPVWHKPGMGPIPAGDPQNELGTRWMPMVPAEEGLPNDLGIHGTIAPETIGKFESKGCARMHNSDAEELFDLVVRATPVEVVETIEPSEAPSPTESPMQEGEGEAPQTL